MNSYFRVVAVLNKIVFVPWDSTKPLGNAAIQVTATVLCGLEAKGPWQVKNNVLQFDVLPLTPSSQQQKTLLSISCASHYSQCFRLRAPPMAAGSAFLRAPLSQGWEEAKPPRGNVGCKNKHLATEQGEEASRLPLYLGLVNACVRFSRIKKKKKKGT